jgi:hypothetical protein
VGTVLLLVALFALFWIWRRIHGVLERRLLQRVQSLEAKSYRLVNAQSVWNGLRGILNVLQGLAFLALLYVYLHVVLARFPATRGIAARLGDYAVGPLRTMGGGLLAYIPNLIFLVVLFLVVRFALRLTRLFFESVEQGTISFGSFEPDWAGPTYRLVRLGILAFAVVAAYPFLPGSGTAAFQGVVALPRPDGLAGVGIRGVELHRRLRPHLPACLPRGGRDPRRRQGGQGRGDAPAGHAPEDSQERGADRPQRHPPEYRGRELQLPRPGEGRRPDPPHHGGDRIRHALAPGGGHAAPGREPHGGFARPSRRPS